jgi:stage II sporulation protein D
MSRDESARGIGRTPRGGDWAATLLLVFGSCVPPEPVPQPIPEHRDPDFRIAVLVNVRQATIGGDALRVEDPAEGDLRTVAGGSTLSVSYRGSVVGLSGSGSRIERRVLVVRPADSGGAVRLNGRVYRGALELRRGDSGLVVVNVVPLEQYLAGVVGAEMGIRAADEIEALKAQAIVSRTYAIRNQGRWKDHGFDLIGTVNDQAYTGELSENALATAAVVATRGQVLTWNGQPIDAFYFSTCGGRTEDGTAAFAGAGRPYLRSIEDRDPSGTPWCATSPRFHWTVGWTASQLAATLRRTLPAENLPRTRAADLRDLRVIDRTATGRIASLELAGRNGRTVLTGQAIRRVLSPTDGGLLRSTDFTVRITRTGGTIERIDMDGRGNGHGVGMCQWGAIGRARAGQDVRTILTSYFPGTDIQRLY